MPAEALTGAKTAWAERRRRAEVLDLLAGRDQSLGSHIEVLGAPARPPIPDDPVAKGR